MPTISKRAQHTPASPIRSLMPLAQAAIDRGTKIYHLNIGDPDFDMAPKVKEALIEKAQTLTNLPYPAFRGDKQMLEAWQAYYKAIAIPQAVKDTNLLITAGASDAMVLSCAVVADPGDEILVFEPFFAPYLTYGSFLNINIKAVTLRQEDNYHLPSTEEIEKCITDKTKAIIITNPNNPTGTVFNREELQTLLAVCGKYNLFLICDETYRGMSFDGLESLSMLHVAKEEDHERIIIADSISKRLNVCGARMGVLLSPNESVVQAAFSITQGRPFASYLEQQITAPALADSLGYLQWLKGEYQKRRDIFIKTLSEKLQTKIHTPEGAFYAMVNLPIEDTDAFAKWLLTDFSYEGQTVMVSPGSGFYATAGLGKQEIRVAYILNEEDLKRSAELLAMAVKTYKNEVK